MSAAEVKQYVHCEHCQEPFEHNPLYPTKRHCGAKCRADSWYAENRKRHIQNTTQRKKMSREGKAGGRDGKWMMAAPKYDTHLPGGFLELHSDTPLRWPLEHRNLRGLHGAITALSEEGHDPMVPRFVLVPWHRGIGWGVYFMGSDTLDKMKGTRHEMRLYEQVLSVRFGGAIRLKAPVVERQGRRRLRIDAITPVCTRHEGVTHMRASGPNLLNTLCAWLPRRIGVEIGEDDARLTILQNDTHAAHVPMGGKYGTVSGYDGSMVVECNAVAEWLLRVAEVIGLGGQCARGFGRVKISEEQ